MLADLLCIQAACRDLTSEADPHGRMAKAKVALETAFGEIFAIAPGC